MGVTAKAKSAIFHVNASIAGVDKIRLHLMQARVALRKDDDQSKQQLDFVEQALGEFVLSCANAAQVIEDGNPSKTEDA